MVREPRVYDMAFIRRLLELGEKYDLQGDIFWRCGKVYGGGNYDDPATFFINCSDTFWWGTADGEDVTPENIDALEKALADCKTAHPTLGHIYGTELFACRIRGLRPQGAAYPKEPELWPLFDACGPERAVEFGNPKKHPRDREPAAK